MEKEFEFRRTEEDTNESVELLNGVKANLINTSWEILENIKNSQVDTYREDKEVAELFYTQNIIKLMPEDVDGLCLYSDKKFIREEAKEKNSEDICIWGPEELKNYVNKLKRFRKKTFFNL